LATQGEREARFTVGLKDLAQEIAMLHGEQAARREAQSVLREQLRFLQTAGEAAALSPEMQQAYRNYMRLATAQKGLAAQVLENLEQRRKVLEEEKALLVALKPQLESLEAGWKAQLLKTQAGLSLREELARLSQGLAALPSRGRDWLTRLVQTGKLRSFLQGTLLPLLGLLAFLALLGWGTRRLNRAAAGRLQIWQVKARDWRGQARLQVARLLLARIFSLGLILWVGLAFWTQGLLPLPLAQVVLYSLAALVALRLALGLVSAFFAGGKAEVLPLDPATARFYRRSLKLFLAYLLLGALGLKGADLLGLLPGSQQFLEHLYRVGLLAWTLWLLKPRPLARILDEMPGSSWRLGPQTLGLLRSVVFLLLAVTILSGLLGFYNLSVYVAGAATWSLAVLVLLLMAIPAAWEAVSLVLHPEEGWAAQKYPEQRERLSSLHHLTRRGLTLLLLAAGALAVLQAWGLPPSRVGEAFHWIGRGPTLGPLRLTPLHIGAAVLVLCLGLALSRLSRSLVSARLYPRTDWDDHVRYTISATLHYVILILAGLLALNMLGFSLTNLALVAGALGVGVGFGMQSLVANFVSGLILLFERPIKVGDLLVVDGQWGLVKAIRVRSTVFETFDRYVLIIPNSEMLSQKIVNWTHYGAGINRLELKVSVSYGADVRQVTQVLTAVCRANARVVPEPGPEVFFKAYGESALDFTVWVFLGSPADRIPATHELNSAIFEAFREHGIEIPFPQRDLHIKNWPPVLEGEGEEGRGDEDPSSA
jgi:potassium efflux system protein